MLEEATTERRVLPYPFYSGMCLGPMDTLVLQRGQTSGNSGPLTLEGSSDTTHPPPFVQDDICLLFYIKQPASRLGKINPRFIGRGSEEGPRKRRGESNSCICRWDGIDPRDSRQSKLGPWLYSRGDVTWGGGSRLKENH